MPYSITTKDGITIRNIPDDIPSDSKQLKDRVTKIRNEQGMQLPGVPEDVPTFEGAPPATPARPEQPSIGIGEGILGAAETGLTALTGATTGAAGYVGGAIKGIAESALSGEFGTQEGARRAQEEALRLSGELTYEPRTEAGRRIAGGLAEVGEAVAPIAAPLAPMSAELNTITQSLRAASPILRDMAPSIRKSSPEVGEPVFAGERQGRPSAGAAGVEGATLRTEKAEALPVPVKLTKGAAERDPEQLAFEKEMTKNPQLGQPLRDRAEENNLQALQNFDELIDMTDAQAPDISATGNSVIKALSEGYKQAKNKTRAAYSAARKSDEAKQPVDTSKPVDIGLEDGPTTFAGYINNKTPGVPSSAVTDVAKTLAEKMGIGAVDSDGNLVLRDGLTVADVENFRKEFNGTANPTIPVQVMDETVIKKLIDGQLEDAGGTLYKKARKTRREQARKYENRAVVARLITNIRGMDDPKVSADQVFRKSILNSSPEEITFLKRVLNTAGDDGKQAWNELRGATLRHIRDEATKGMGMDSNDNQLISPAKLHNVVTQLDKNGRLDLMFGKQQAEVIRDLNEVIRYVNTVPPGTLINNSGTAGMILAALAEAGGYGATVGIPVPVLTGMKYLRGVIQDRKIKRKIDEALNGLENRQ